MNIDSIKNGYVIDHIQAGKAMEIYDLLNLNELDCQVAIITNAKSKKTGKKDIKVAVGRDSRLSGEALSNWISSSMVECGLNVTDFKMASTPAMFMSTVTEGYEFDGSVMITASHLPFNRNGFKFFTAGGGLEKQTLKKFLLTLKVMNPLL